MSLVEIEIVAFVGKFLTFHDAKYFDVAFHQRDKIFRRPREDLYFGELDVFRAKVCDRAG